MSGQVVGLHNAVIDLRRRLSYRAGMFVEQPGDSDYIRGLVRGNSRALRDVIEELRSILDEQAG